MMMIDKAKRQSGDYTLRFPSIASGRGADRHQRSNGILPLLVSGMLLLSILGGMSQAQVTTSITPDGTLGTTISPIDNVYNINGGTIRGSNQLHSFDRFSVGTGDIASFNGPSGIQNILSRVTGGARSDIDGTLRSTINGANLFLLNPKGVVFGPNATLDVSGSFHVSTADSIRLGDDGMFHVDPGKQSVLTFSPPAAFGFLGDQAQITINKSTLEVPEGENLWVVGQDIGTNPDTEKGVYVQGGTLIVPTGEIHLVSAPEDMTDSEIPLESLNEGFLPAPEGDDSGASIVIRAGHFRMVGGSVIAQSEEEETTGDIHVDVGSLTLTEGGQIRSEAPKTSGSAANIVVQVEDTASFSGHRGADSSGIISSAQAEGEIDAGNIDIEARNLKLDDSKIQSISLGTGAAGQITIHATDQVQSEQLGEISLTRDARVSVAGEGRSTVVIRGGRLMVDRAEIFADAKGDATDLPVGIDIDMTGDLVLANRARVRTSVIAEAGTAQNIKVNANQVIVSNDAVLGSFSERVPTGQAPQMRNSGNVTITAESVQVKDGGTIESRTHSIGDGGQVKITADKLEVGGDSSIRVDTDSVGHAGQVEITVDDTLKVESGGNIRADSAGSGNAGRMMIKADTLKIADGGRIHADTKGTAINFSSGSAGDIDIEVGQLIIEGGDISTSGIGTKPGPAGTITIKEVNTITISGENSLEGGIFSVAKGEADFFTGDPYDGDGGQIMLFTDSLKVATGGRISALASGIGNDGTIVLNGQPISLDAPALEIAGGFIDGLTTGEITLDDSFGPSMSLMGPDFLIEADMGRREGNNLFHSFSQFRLMAEETATFAGPLVIDNIINRVTGGEPMLIDGTIQSSIPDANIFFLNPKGVLITAEGSLEVPGSFYVSTADYLKLDDSTRFFSGSTGLSGVTAGNPTAFGFANSAPASITLQENTVSIRGKTLEVSGTETLSVVGGDIKSLGGSLEGGQINLVSVASPGEVIFSDVPDVQVLPKPLGEIAMSHGAHMSGESIVIRGRTLTMDNTYARGRIDTEMQEAVTLTTTSIDTSEGFPLDGNVGETASISFSTDGPLLMDGGGIFTGLVLASGDTGNVELKAKTITLTNAATIETGIVEGGGLAGDVSLNADEITLTGGAFITTSSDLAGVPGQVILNAPGGSVTVMGEVPTGHSHPFNRFTTVSTTTNGAADAANITVNAAKLKLKDGAKIVSGVGAQGLGKGGEITITATESVEISGDGSFISTSTSPGIRFSPDEAKGGRIDISAPILTMDGGEISSSTSVESDGGDAGDVVLNIGSLDLKGSAQINSSSFGLTSISSDLPPGNAGTVTVQGLGGDTLANSVTLSNSSLLTTAELGEGGSIKIDADTITLKDGSTISASVKDVPEDAQADTALADIILTASDVQITDSSIEANTTGSRDGGQIKLITDTLTMDDIESTGPETKISTITEGSGRAGGIEVQANSVMLKKGARLDSSTSGQGIGGNVLVQGIGNLFTPADSVAVTGSGSGLFATTEGEKPGGNVRIVSDLLTMEDGALLSSNTSGTGDAGSVFLQVGTLEAEDSTVSSSSTSPSGGNPGSLTVLGQDVTSSQPATKVTLINSDLLTQINGTDAGRKVGPEDIGQIQVIANELILQDSNISGTTAGIGDGSEIRLNVGRLEANDSTISSRSTSSATGDAGLIFITGNQGGNSLASGIVLTNSEVSTSTEGVGGGGNIDVLANDVDLLERSTLSATTLGTGVAGSITMNVERLRAQAQSRITSSSTGTATGDAGPITVTASESIVMSEASTISSSTDGTGDSGNITVFAPNILLTDGSSIEVESRGSSTTTSSLTGNDKQGVSNANAEKPGAAGSIFIGSDSNPIRDLTLSNATISAFAKEGPETEPREGNIAIRSNGFFLMEKGSMITASVGTGLGGDITIRKPEYTVMRDGSQILARTDIGTGGRIEIDTDLFIADASSIISADAGVGTSGTVNLNAPEVDIQTGLEGLSTDFLDASKLLRQSCAVRAAGEGEGSFVVARRHGLPSTPEDLLQAFDVAAAAPVQPPAADLAEPAGEELMVAQLAMAEGERAFRGGKLKEAEEQWANASELYADINDPGARSDALRGLGQTQQAMGHHAEAVQTLRQALNLAEQQEDQGRIASTLSSLGNAYLAVGGASVARELFNRGIVIAKASGNHELEAVLQNNLGNLYASQKHFLEALEAYEASAQLSGKLGETLQEARARSNAARAAFEGGKIQDGMALIGEALERVQALPDTHEKIYVLIHVARSYKELAVLDEGQKKESLLNAYKALNSAIALALKSDDKRALSYATGNLGMLYQGQHRYDEALYIIRKALRSAEAAEAPELEYRWRWKEGQILWAQGSAGPAIDSYRRAVEILEETRQEALSRYGSAEVYFRRAVEPVYLDLVKALIKASEMVKEDPTLSDQLLIDARGTVEQLKAAELRNYFQDECVAELTAKKIELDKVPGNAAVVYPILLPERIELLVTLPSGLKRYTVAASNEELNNAVKEFRSELFNREGAEYLNTGKILYDWLVRPYVNDLAAAKISTMVFVPSGILRTIPIAAFHDGQQFLIERYALAVTPGLDLVDPQPLDRSSPDPLLVGVSEAVQGQPALPFVPEELRAVQQDFGGRVLINEDFDKERFETEISQRIPSIIHVASHAQFTGDPDDSFLLTYRDKITMDELSGMVGVAKFREEPIELLMLSACQTAAGDERAALGLAGVAIQAGARSAVGSLWNIADEAAYEIVREFYQQLKDDLSISKAEALRQSQLKLLKGEKFSHPFYWSPFLMINNWL